MTTTDTTDTALLLSNPRLLAHQFTEIATREYRQSPAFRQAVCDLLDFEATRFPRNTTDQHGIQVAQRIVQGELVDPEEHEETLTYHRQQWRVNHQGPDLLHEMIVCLLGWETTPPMHFMHHLPGVTKAALIKALKHPGLKK